MSADFILSLTSLLAALASVVVSLSRKNDRKIESEMAARDSLGKKYATLGWAYSRAQKDSSESAEKARRHAVEGFVIADTAADGKRDFTDKQAGVYVDAHR